jgi:hypothetical protein
LLEIKRLSAVAGSSLTLLLYDEIQRQKRDIFDVFVADIMRIASLPHVDAAQANERQPLEMTEFMRLMLVRIGTWKEEADVNIGRVLHYMLGTKNRQRIIKTVAHVSGARKVIVVDRRTPVFRRIERALFRKYRTLMVPRPASRRIFLRGREECAYYDGDILLADRHVTRLLDEMTAKFHPGGLRLWVMGWSRFWLTLWRRIVKFFRR